MERREFLQYGITAAALTSLKPIVSSAAEAEDDSGSTVSLIRGRFFTQIGTIGRLIVYDNKVYCEHQEIFRGGMTMVVRSFAKAKEELASGKLVERARGNEGIDKFLAHDDEGRLVIVNELSDATKWSVGPGNGEPFKKYKTDRDDTISGASLQHAVGFNMKFFLGLSPDVETRKVKNRSNQEFERKVQQLVLTEKADSSLALWINDFSGK